MSLSAIDVGQGPPVVLLHGQPGSAGDWAPVTALLRDRVRVIAPDRPGYGRSGGRAGGFRDNAAALVALLDRLQIDSAVIAGHSWAAGVALATAIGSPERVRGLVLASPVSPGIPAGLLDRMLANRLIGAPAIRLGLMFAGLGLGLPPVRRLARNTVPALPPDQVAATASRWRADRGVWRSFYAEQRALVAELPSLEPELERIEAPATVLYGTRDWITTPSHARHLAGALPQARLVPIEGAGHMLPQKRPAAVADAVARLAV